MAPNLPMSIFFWNCQGVGNPLTIHTLKGLCKLHSPGGVFLAETKNRRYKVEQVCRELGFSNFFVVDPEGTGGGLCFMWKKGITVCVIGSSNYWVDMEVRFEDGKLWRYTGIYASTDMRERRLIWDEVSNFRIQGDVLWVIMGDFNAIVSNNEKRGGNEKGDWELRDFQQFIRSNQLIDVGYVGYPFTWNNKRAGGDNIRIQLDRALASSKWRTDYPDVILRHLKARGSDHCPIILSKSAAEGFPKPRFIFDSRWVKERQCGEIVRRCWGQEIRGSRWFSIQRRLKICRQKLRAWRSRTQLDSRHTIRDLELQLDELEEETVFDGVSYKEKEGRLKLAVREEEKYWRTKSRVKWLQLGDRNTAFFHARTAQRRVQNRIHGLEDEHGSWKEGNNEIQGIILRYFSAIFSSSDPAGFDTVLNCVGERVTESMNRRLIRPLRAEEVTEAVFQIDPAKSPGPDGFTASFFQNYWDILAMDIIDAVRSFMFSGRLLRGINHTHLVLIPKVKCPMSMGQLRPISLCNVVYKVVAKVLTNRLSECLPHIISGNQSAFVAGRIISDNVLIGQEVIHHLKSKRKGKQSGMAIKLDMSKAYDRVEWSFVEAIMRRLGFNERWIGWIMECITTPSYSVLINGSSHRYVLPSRGIRQGDPLSPYLFVLCAEGLSAMLHESERRGSIHGIRVCRGAPSVSHLFFADDTLIFARADGAKTATIKGILNSYGLASGQLINYSKSAMFFSTNTPHQIRDNLCHVMEVRRDATLGNYLGLPADISRSKRAVFAFVKDKMITRIDD